MAFRSFYRPSLVESTGSVNQTLNITSIATAEVVSSPVPPSRSTSITAIATGEVVSSPVPPSRSTSVTSILTGEAVGTISLTFAGIVSVASTVSAEAFGNPTRSLGAVKRRIVSIEGDIAPPTTYARTSVAYDTRGDQVLAGVPRYESSPFGAELLLPEAQTFSNNLVNDWVSAGNRTTTAANGVLTVGPANNGDTRMAAFPKVSVSLGDWLAFTAQVRIVSGTATPTDISGYGTGFLTYWGAEAQGTAATTQRRDLSGGVWEYKWRVQITTLGNGVYRSGFVYANNTIANDTTVEIDNASVTSGLAVRIDEATTNLFTQAESENLSVSV